MRLPFVFDYVIRMKGVICCKCGPGTHTKHTRYSVPYLYMQFHCLLSDWMRMRWFGLGLQSLCFVYVCIIVLMDIGLSGLRSHCNCKLSTGKDRVIQIRAIYMLLIGHHKKIIAFVISIENINKLYFHNAYI